MCNVVSVTFEELYIQGFVNLYIWTSFSSCGLRQNTSRIPEGSKVMVAEGQTTEVQTATPARTRFVTAEQFAELPKHCQHDESWATWLTPASEVSLVEKMLQLQAAATMSLREAVFVAGCYFHCIQGAQPHVHRSHAHWRSIRNRPQYTAHMQRLSPALGWSSRLFNQKLRVRLIRVTLICFLGTVGGRSISTLVSAWDRTHRPGSNSVAFSPNACPDWPGSEPHSLYGGE
eukprot:g58111.t1